MLTAEQKVATPLGDGLVRVDGHAPSARIDLRAVPLSDLELLDDVDHEGIECALAVVTFPNQVQPRDAVVISVDFHGEPTLDGDEDTLSFDYQLSEGALSISSFDEACLLRRATSVEFHSSKFGHGFAMQVRSSLPGTTIPIGFAWAARPGYSQREDFGVYEIAEAALHLDWKY